MGQQKNGILGGVTGKVGTITGSTWNKKHYIRANSGKRRKNSFSEEQLAQQAKFAVMAKFLGNLTEISMVSFRSADGDMTGANSALSYNIRTAIGGNYPNFHINYPDVLISYGKLVNGKDMLATAEAGGMIKFKWTDNSGIGRSAATDVCTVVIYNPEEDICISTLAGAERSVETFQIDASYLSGKDVETWIGFISADRKRIAKSVYTGKLRVL